MYLFHKTLVFGSNVNQVIAGHFLGTDEKQLVVLRGTSITLYNSTDGACIPVLTSPLFAVGRCVDCLHLMDYNKDLIVLTSDSGCLSILEYETKSHAFKSVYNYKFGETGCLFRTPGQYLRVCPNNRCIAVGGLNGDVLLFPVQYTLNESYTAIQFQSAGPLVCHAASRLVYDMVWIDERTLCTLAASMEDGSKALDCYAVRDDRLVYTPSYISLDAKGSYTRLIFCHFDAAALPVVSESVIVVSPGTLTFFRLGASQTTTTVNYSPPGASLLTAACVLPQGLVFATDRGEVLLISPEQTSLVMLAQHRIGEAGFRALCSDGASLFLFSEMGITVSVPLAAIGAGPLPKEAFMDGSFAVPQCTRIQPIASASAVRRYIGLVGHGKSSCVSAVGLGVSCVLQGIFSLKEGMRVARIFTLADLANPADHKFMILTGKAFTMVTTLNDHGSFEAVSSLFELKEPTLNMGVMNGHYVQITPTKVLALTASEVRGSWSLAGDSRILYSHLGAQFVLLITNKREIVCLRLREEGGATQFTTLEKGIQKEMTCIMEYKGSILVGMKERSIACFAVEGTTLMEKGTFPVSSIPHCLYSFCAITAPQYSQFCSSSDDALLIGGDTGMLTIASLDLAGEGLRVISEVRVDAKPVYFADCVLRGVPVLLVSAGASYRLIFRNDIFNVQPVFFRSKLDKTHQSFSPSSHIDNLAIYHKANRLHTLMWQNSNVLTVRLDIESPGASIYSRIIGITGRQIISLPRGNAIVTGYDVAQHQGAVTFPRYARAFWFDNNGCFQMKDLTKALLRHGNDLVSCACCFGRGQSEGEEKGWLVLGTFTGTVSGAAEYHLSLFRGDLSNMFGIASSERAIAELWRQPMEAKLFFALHLQDAKIAVVCGFFLRVYEVSETGLELVAQLRCTDSFVTAIQFEQGRFYCVDNEGVLRVIACTRDWQLVTLLRHDTHRSLMRCCVLDDVTVAVGDKYGSVLIYRSLYPVTDMPVDIDAEVLRARTESGYAMALISAFYVGEVVTSLFKQASGKASGKADVLMYSTINGAIGCLSPVDDLEKLKTIVAMESLIIGRGVSLVGRIVDDFRSSFVPSLGVVDGDICKKFFDYSVEEQEEMAKQLELSVTKIKEILFEVNDI